MSTPLIYRLFFLYIEPISALLGAYWAGARPAEYLSLLTAPTTTTTARTAPSPPTLIALYQLSNLYLLFALNEHLVLASTSSRRTWRALLFCLLVADLGHLATMAPLGASVYVAFWRWNAIEWGSVGFVYVGAAMRSCYLLGVGLDAQPEVGAGREDKRK